jgi:putative SbcD/Mre11-related phosphoesterase
MKILYNAPAIFHKGALIIGDTHFGMERKLRGRGVYDEQFSMRLFLKLKELVVKHKVRVLIFLGDVKEEISAIDPMTEQILAKLSLLCRIIIAKGNHDGGIEKCGNADIKPPEGFVYEKLGLLHGHSWPAEELMQCDYLIIGHQHPMIATSDKFGRKHKEPVWIIANPNAKIISQHYKKFNRKIKLIIAPAFNPIIGSVINNDEKRRFGPLINNKLFKLNDALVFQLNGICLGKLNEI